MLGVRVTSAESTELFVGPPDALLQVVRVGYLGASGADTLRVTGDGLRSDDVMPPAGDGVVEIAVRVARPVPGQRRAADAGADFPFEFVVAEPGWTMYMVGHFHYDPVWGNTQGAYTTLWTEEPWPGPADQRVRADLRRFIADWRAAGRGMATRC
ncbi:hypothetical protein MSAR_25190 [Mycolicibacterium sarraceniae]|uniref:Alpha-mannosidase n=1 Tax=Mycolicibacterium sarraceniae TaxID=1534348 RepID=A0A7I7SRM7_9MYCO|nr:hypothetical protein MSAR_25190 [Mycolicibacterium sarraceniae]